MVSEHEIDFVHCVFQELEDLKIQLPMGDYNEVYRILENVREHIFGR